MTLEFNIILHVRRYGKKVHTKYSFLQLISKGDCDVACHINMIIKNVVVITNISCVLLRA